MTVRLRVHAAAWDRHVAEVVAATPGLVPVIKGNGYGLGRTMLARRASVFADTVAVGTVHELDGPTITAAAGLDVVVLTPTLHPPPPSVDVSPVLTVGRVEHIDALRGWSGRVLVKLASSMRRYGGGPELIAAASRAGLEVIGVSVHPPLAGSDEDHLADVGRWLPQVDPGLEVWISHLDVSARAGLPTSHRYRVRLGTALWHGDKSMLQLTADVLDTRPVDAGTPLGYRQRPADVAGTIVMIGAGTANGVHPLPDGRSPFHFARRRLGLVEPPHMHTSMVLVPDGDPCPEIGHDVDVQRPLTSTQIDVVEFV